MKTITNEIANSSLLRQMSLLSLEELEGATVHIFGVGGIGGPTALLLAKMGISKIHLYDKDIVEPHNVGSQLFGPSNIGQKKVDAIKMAIKQFVPDDQTECTCHDCDIKTLDFKNWDSLIKDREKTIFVFALDSNDLRLWLYEQFQKNFTQSKPIYIVDPRMGGLGFSVDANHIQTALRKYKDFTPLDKEIRDDICTARAISFNTFGCASMVAGIVRKILKGHCLPRISFDFHNFFYEDANEIYTKSNI